MGAWGHKPFQNDGAADWFADLWEKFPIQEKVEETLKLEPTQNYEEIRAAAYLLIQLCDTYTWPTDLIDSQCDLAARRLEEMIDLEEFNEEFCEELRREIQILRSRISCQFARNET